MRAQHLNVAKWAGLRHFERGSKALLGPMFQALKRAEAHWGVANCKAVSWGSMLFSKRDGPPCKVAFFSWRGDRCRLWGKWEGV